jgi:hypothetical protein
LLTIGNTVLISTQDEDDDWKPESDHLASGAAGGHTEHDGHAHHHVCWNCTKEDLAPVFGKLLAHAQAVRPTRQRRLTWSFELAENEFIQIRPILRSAEKVGEIAEEVADKQRSSPVANIYENGMPDARPERDLLIHKTLFA